MQKQVEANKTSLALIHWRWRIQIHLHRQTGKQANLVMSVTRTHLWDYVFPASLQASLKTDVTGCSNLGRNISLCKNILLSHCQKSDQEMTHIFHCCSKGKILQRSLWDLVVEVPIKNFKLLCLIIKFQNKNKIKISKANVTLCLWKYQIVTVKMKTCSGAWLMWATFYLCISSYNEYI